MSSAIGIELRLFFNAFLLGVMLIFLYDFLRIFRNIINHRKNYIAVEDTIYWIIAGFIVFVMLYHNNDGIIRWFAIAGVTLGMFLYNFSISKIIVKYVSIVLNKIINILFTPLIRISKKIINLLKKKLKSIKMKQREKKEKAKIQRDGVRIEKEKKKKEKHK